MPYLTHPDLPGQGFDVAGDEAARAWGRSGWVPGERPVPVDESESDDAAQSPPAEQPARRTPPKEK